MDDAKQGARNQWSEGGVLTLLEVYESKWVLRNRAKLKGSDWDDIASQVSVRCSGKTASQCKNKIESMKKRYRAESAISQQPGSCSSWHLYARMEDLMKGSCISPALPMLENNASIQVQPKVEGHLQDCNQDDESHKVPGDANVHVIKLSNNEKSATDSDASGPRSVWDSMERECDRAKRRRRWGTGVAESIRLLANSLLKIEQARLEVYRDSERMRVEAEMKRGEMKLKRMEIIAKTRLQIAKFFSNDALQERSKKSKDSSSSREADEILRDGVVTQILCTLLNGV